MLLSSSQQPEDMNPKSLLLWAQAATDRHQGRDLPIISCIPWPAPASHLGQPCRKETSPVGWSKGQKPWEGRGDVLTPKPEAAQSRAGTTCCKKIKEWFCAQERQGDGQVGDRPSRDARAPASSAGKPGLLGLRSGEVPIAQLFFRQGNAAVNFGVSFKKMAFRENN